MERKGRECSCSPESILKACQAKQLGNNGKICRRNGKLRVVKMAIKVGIVGYGTIGKRVADAVAMQKDMKLVGVTAHSYSFNTEVAKQKGYRIFSIDGDSELKENGIKPDGTIKNLLDDAEVIVDATPKKVGKENLDSYYSPKKIKAIFQGGEKHETAGT